MVESSISLDYPQVLQAVAQSAARSAAQSAAQSTAKSVPRPSTDRPSPAQVIDALLAAERAAKQQHQTYPPEALLGQWRLYFATGTRKRRQGGITLGRGFYLPRFVQAQIGFDRADPPADPDTCPPENGLDAVDPEQLQISNQLQVGLFRLGFLGPARYRHPKNLLAFDFTQVQLDFLSTALYRGKFRRSKTQTPFAQRSIARLPFFSFFWVSDQLIAARGRGGGLAIWIKTSQSAE